MRIVDVDQGSLVVRWMWLPFWIAANPNVIAELDEWVRDLALLNSATADDPDLDALNKAVIKKLASRYAIPGLYSFLQHGYAHLQTTK